MLIFVDESGTFTPTENVDAFSVVAAYVIPEDQLTSANNSLLNLKKACGVSSKEELKLRNVTNDHLPSFLAELSNLDGILFAVAVDTSGYSKEAAITERERLVHQLLEQAKSVRHSFGQEEIRKDAKYLSELSPQLFNQLLCHAYLLHAVISYGTAYLVQKSPDTLSRFAWRIDRKNEVTSPYDKAATCLTHNLVMSIALIEPILRVYGADYRSFAKFEFGDPDNFGVRNINFRKIFLEDLEFVDSKKCAGVQIVDLLASSLRRLLKHKVAQSTPIVDLLGSLMILQGDQGVPVTLLGENKSQVSPPILEIVNKLRRSGKRLSRR
ncbi:DUF3800 domain-containing protein [Xanthomonas sp. 10-10]|uniref:DUF3800 domain-containing protein n=1 Tax=Xanthomonas sp. 10-10 TaxID=3115848 RepID=A0AAU7P8F2_9XANT